mgnify:CR=1 FL=1
MATPITLDGLLRVLRRAPRNDIAAETEYAHEHGLPVRFGGIDWTSLPTFGGADPGNTVGIWSWDATRLLVGLLMPLRANEQGRPGWLDAPKPLPVATILETPAYYTDLNTAAEA